MRAGGTRVEFAKLFRRNTCTRQVMETICRLHVFFTRKCVQENRGSSKEAIFLLKNNVFRLWFHYICREFADSTAHGGNFAPPCPPNIRYWFCGIKQIKKLVINCNIYLKFNINIIPVKIMY